MVIIKFVMTDVNGVRVQNVMLFVIMKKKLANQYLVQITHNVLFGKIV
jgi:hypothetical protein